MHTSYAKRILECQHEQQGRQTQLLKSRYRFRYHQKAKFEYVHRRGYREGQWVQLPPTLTHYYAHISNYYIVIMTCLQELRI